MLERAEKQTTGREARLLLLGAFALHLPGGEAVVTSKKSRALLALLALSPGRRMSREKLCGLLWGDRGDEQARASLRQALVVLRRELGAGEALVFAQQDETLALRTDGLAVDVLEIAGLQAAGDAASLARAADLCRGELLADTVLREAGFDDWLAAERRRVADMLAALHERIAATGEGQSAVAAARRLLAFDPFRESSHRLLMQALANAGEKALALKQYEECERLLEAEFGVQPGAELQELRRRIMEPDTAAAVSPAPQKTKPTAAEPVVAVLPFAFHGGEALRYLEDGIAEDIVTELSRHRNLRVTASASAAALRAVNDPQRAGQALGATHVVTGSLRPAGDKFRMSAQLVDVASGATLWSERFDLSRDDVQSSLDRLVTAIAPVVERRIGSSGAEQASRRPVASWNAYDHYLKGRDLSLRFRDTEAVPYLEKATELDPAFAPAFAWRAFAYVGMECWRTEPGKMDQAEQSARRAIALDENDARGHHALGYVRLWQKKHDLAGHHYEHGLKLNPSDMLINYDKANLLSYIGEPGEGLALCARMQERDPFPPVYVYEVRGRALFQMGRYAEALAEFENLAAHHLWIYWWRAACYVHLGRLPEAREDIRRLLADKPDVTLDFIRSMTAFSSPAYCQTLFDALAAAGLPES